MESVHLVQQKSTCRLRIDGVLHSGATTHRRTVESGASRMAEKVLHASRSCQLELLGDSGGVEKVPATSNGVNPVKENILFRLNMFGTTMNSNFTVHRSRLKSLPTSVEVGNWDADFRLGLKSASDSPISDIFPV